jgi:uncharacterized lipoprotein YddW (UPF0748 family)
MEIPVAGNLSKVLSYHSQMKQFGLLAIACVAILSTFRPALQSSAPATAAPVDIQPPPMAREFRGAWISPVWRSDWPSRPGLTPDSQRAELRALLDRAQATGLNAVLLHVRTAADALYPSTRAPWSAYLTGELGRAPEPLYDPLAFAVAEAHSRGIELHAWFNPFRAAAPGYKPTRIEHPDWVVTYGSQKWIDPGIPQARRAALDAILEVVDRYDVDGIHLDDYFYPYLENDRKGRTIRFPDDATFARFGKSFASRPDWRRSNIDDFVASVYREVKAHKPWIAVGISPFGIWRPGHPAGITGLNAYSEIFADSRRWLREGWVDYMAPQLYWPIDGAQSRFTRLNEWWREQNIRQRHLWPGLHTERETVTRSPWSAGEIQRQIGVLRAANSPGGGHIHFRMSALRPLSSALHSTSYAEPALTPAMPWLDARIPAPPTLSISMSALSIRTADTVPVRWFAVQTLDAGGRWRLSLHRANTEIRLPLRATEKPKAVAATAVTPTGMESAPTVIVQGE